MSLLRNGLKIGGLLLLLQAGTALAQTDVPRELTINCNQFGATGLADAYLTWKTGGSPAALERHVYCSAGSSHTFLEIQPGGADNWELRIVTSNAGQSVNECRSSGTFTAGDGETIRETCRGTEHSRVTVTVGRWR